MRKECNRVLVMLTFFASAVMAGEVGLCRQLQDNQARLSCYDQHYGAPVMAVKLPAIESATALSTPVAAVPVTSPMVAALATVPTPSMTATERFGMENRVGQSDRVENLESRILGNFIGWEPKQKFELENGQVWQVSDGSAAYFRVTDPRVWVERGAFGAFFLRIDGLNKRPKVKRIK